MFNNNADTGVSHATRLPEQDPLGFLVSTVVIIWRIVTRDDDDVERHGGRRAYSARVPLMRFVPSSLTRVSGS